MPVINKPFLITLVRPFPCNSQLTIEVEFGVWHTTKSVAEWGREYYSREWPGWKLDSVIYVEGTQ